MITDKYISTIADDLRLGAGQVKAAAGLLVGGATVPFIARYRREVTGSLDEVAVTAIRDRLDELTVLEKRRKAILKSLTERKLLNGELERKLSEATDLSNLEDIYLPYRPKRRTRAQIARERGLEPLASAIFQGRDRDVLPEKYINLEKDVNTLHDAFAGAQDIIAEWINEDRVVRSLLRRKFETESYFISKVVEKRREEGKKFRNYFAYQEKCATIPGYRLLALFRGENEKILKVTVRPDSEKMIDLLQQKLAKSSRFRKQMLLAVADSYKRLLLPSLENELRKKLKERADSEAIGVFAENVKELLLAPPLGQKRVMALDPGFRTGVKLVCLDEFGRLLHFSTIYPTMGEEQRKRAEVEVTKLLQKYDIEAIGIGNGTAGRETEQFIRKVVKDVIITFVNEDGASVYSASEVARKEFPDHDITVRGAVSIGRRLQDPLSELVKIDPKSVGVGQYQHDVDQRALRKALVDVVVSCVNSVGVELNSASAELLTYVSGLGPVLAANIVQYRHENGSFTSRKELLKVPKLGARVFEQCAGFLRIHGASNPLDSSSVHPERYGTVEKMARDAGVTIAELMKDAEVRKKIPLAKYQGADIGLPTLRDIMTELEKPGRDPRPVFRNFTTFGNVHNVEDLVEGMKLPGVVTNITKFGAFVDVGVHQDGLIHISELSDRFVKDPAEVVKMNQHLTVRVLNVDRERGRISLSLKNI